MRTAILTIGLSMLLLGTSAAEYDRQRHDQIKEAIKGDTNELLGKSLSEVTKQLNLENVPWDKGWTNYPSGELRIYHFRGFLLVLHLKRLPKGVTPTSQESYDYTEDELERTGVWWLAAFNPAVHVDHLDDPKARRKKYWEVLGRGFAERNRLLERERAKTPPPK